MITKAPLRISFAGGGTDIEPYCSQHGSIVLSAAIQKYAYSETTGSKLHTPLEQTVLHHFNTNSLRIKCEAPPMSGLGGSASCFVAGIKAIRPDLSPKALAELAFYLERNVMGIAGGKQDQYMAAYGGMNKLSFRGEDTRVESLEVPEGFEDLFLLVYMGKRNHCGHDIIIDQNSRDNQGNFTNQKQIANEMIDALKKNDMAYFGNMLCLSWLSKKRFSPYVSTGEIDGFFSNCIKNGAIGGKLTGAGGGGYMLLMENANCKGYLRKYLAESKINFEKIKIDTEGARCVK